MDFEKQKLNQSKEIHKVVSEFYSI